MDYQTLTDVLGQSKMGAAPAPSLNSIIQGIQSQYQPAPSMPVQSGLYGANRYMTGTPQFGAIEQVPEYGAMNQFLGQSFVPSEFNRELYSGIDSQRLSDVISTISGDYGGGNDGGSSSGLSIGDFGLASSSNVGPGAVSLAAMGIGAMTGLPAGLLASIIGKQSIANAINAQSHSQAAAFNNALVADQLGLNVSDPANSAALASAIDSLSAAIGETSAATTGIHGTGAAAAQAAQEAAAHALASGLTEAQAAQAAQDAANATVEAGGRSAANATDFGGYGGGYGGGDTSGGYGDAAGYGA